MSTQPFNSDGGFTTPGNINFANNAAIQLTPVTGITIYGNSIDQATALTLNNSGDAALWANANVTINSNSQGSNPQWIFGADGNLSTPGSSGDISGANLITAVTLSATSNVQAANVNALTLSALGNVYANNAIVTNFLSETDMGAVGNIGAGNILTGGFVCAVGNIIGLSSVYAGNGATWQNQVQLANVLYVGADVGEAYVQAAMINTGGNGSADWVAYANNGNTDQGWVDMGFTGNTYNDPEFTVTGPNDGYVFAQGNASYGGNLVLATGNIGTTKDIIFATGGFQTGNIRARLKNSDGSFSVTGPIVTPPVALANLTAVAGARAFVNNANLVAVGNFGAQVGSGGSNVVPVWSNGTNWYIG